VQERIRLPLLGRVVAVEEALRIAEDVVILGVEEDDLDRDRFQAFERLPFPELPPGAEEELPGLVARRMNIRALASSGGTRRGP
jgi:hypothetical protein